MLQYFPIATGNKWEYKQTDGSSYTNTVLSVNGNLVELRNSKKLTPDHMKIKGVAIYNEMLAKNNFQLWLRDDLKTGEQWNLAFRVKGARSEMRFTVVETGLKQAVEGRDYTDVILIEAECSIRVNGRPTTTDFLTQYYYAKGIGLILSISSLGELHALIDYRLN